MPVVDQAADTVELDVECVSGVLVIGDSLVPSGMREEYRQDHCHGPGH